MRSVFFGKYEIFENGDIISTTTGDTIAQRDRGKRKEVRLRVDGVRKNYITSRLVYWLFNPDFDIENKNLCIVADDMINFMVEDLQIVHRRDLIQGDKHIHQAKLTNEQTEEIRRMYVGKTCVNQYDKNGISYQDLADQYGVTKALIAQIIRGETRNKDNYLL